MKQKLAILNKPIIRVIFLTLVPVILCIIGPVLSGKSFFDVWIPYSGWNDEVFYFKQTEAMAGFGCPRGYFGYNESSALYGGFGAWGPVILAPFAAVAKIFGWRLISPCIFNLVLLCLAFFAFSMAYKPDLAKTLLFSALVFLFTPIYRFALSGMAEIMILGFTLLLFALIVGENNEHRVWKQVFMMLILFFLIAVRPYFAVFFPLPWLAGRDERARTRFLPAVSVITGFAAYHLAGKYLSAPYFEGIYNDWIGKCFTHGPRTVAMELLDRLLGSLRTMWFMITDSVTGNNYAGAYYGIFIITTFLVLVNCVICALGAGRDYYDRFNAFLSGWLFLGQVAVLLAILTSYNLFDGYRHLFVFIAVDLLSLIFFTRTRYMNALILACLFLFFFCIKKPAYPAVFAGGQVRENFANDAVTLEESLKVTDELSWDNTVIVVDEDLRAAGVRNADYMEVLYALPAGFAVNYCTQDYVLNNMSSLRSRYLLTYAGSDCDVIAHFNGVKKELTFREYNIYRLR